MIKNFLPLLLFFGFQSTYAQEPVIPSFLDAHRFIEYNSINFDSIHTAIKPFRRGHLSDLLEKSDLLPHHKQYIKAEAGEYLDSLVPAENTLWNTFYKSPNHLFEVYGKNFYIQLDGLLDFTVGTQTCSDCDDFLYHNRRGLHFTGELWDRLYFYTTVIETQQDIPNYINLYEERFNTIPGIGFYKGYMGGKTLDGIDYLYSEGVLGFEVLPDIGIEIGHARNFIGFGERSVLISDFAAPYFQVRLNTRFWKIHYQNVFAELHAFSSRDVKGELLTDKKYMAAHYLSFKPNRKWEVGIYEAVIFHRPDHFEFQYLNPVIFYRTIEGGLNSPDNVLLGSNLMFSPDKNWQFYGQFLLDEFTLSEFFGGDKYWGNKYSLQLGITAYDFLKSGLKAGIEYNTARPFTYMHRDSVSNYIHENQSLAHPLGTNFKELLLHFDYTGHQRWYLEGGMAIVEHGLQGPGPNVGTNLLLSYNNRAGMYGHKTGQGESFDYVYGYLTIHYYLKPKLSLYVNSVARKYSEESDFSNNLVLLGGLVYNFHARPKSF